MPLNLNHLAVFAAIAETGSVSRAAERLMVSQPAVSKQLALLERALKTPLVDRLPRGVRLTAAGQTLADHARRLFAVRDEAERAIAELAGLTRGRLAVAATTTLGVYWLPTALVRYRRQYPGVEMRMEIHPTSTIERLLLDGHVDLGLAESAPAADAVLAREFMRDRLVAVAAPGSPLCRKSAAGRTRPVSAAELCAAPFVVREVGSGSKSLVERALADRGLAVTPVMSLGSTEAIKRAVIEGVGVAIISALACEAELAAGRLVKIPVRGLHIDRPLHLLTPRDRTLPRAAGAFLQLIQSATVTDASPRPGT